MASLTSLPHELLRMICNEIYARNEEFEDLTDRLDCLWALAALAHTSRRLLSAVEPILYERGVEHHWPRPLAWAAKRGYVGTLTKALAAGAQPDQKMQLQMTRVLLSLVNDTQQAMSYLALHEEEWARDMTPTGEQFDVFIPSYEAPVPDPQEHYHGGRRANIQDLAFIRPHVLPQSFETGDFVLRQYTALHLAAREGHIDIVNGLLDHGASLDTPSRWFCPCDPPRGLWQTLMDPVTVDRGVENWSPLHVAICFSRFEVAKCLISRGARTSKGTDNRPAAYKYEALRQAAATGHADLIEYILDLHPEMDVDWQDSLGLTPLYHACANRRWDSTVPLLLAHGADLNSHFRVSDTSSWNELFELTLLGEACRLGRFEDALKLIDLGADINLGLLKLEGNSEAPRTTQITHLHVCYVNFGRGDRERFPFKEHIWGPGQLQEVFRSKLISQTARCWQESGGKMGPWRLPRGDASLAGCKHDNVPALKPLLAAGADPRARDSKGRNAIMMVVEEPRGPRMFDRDLAYRNWGFLPSPPRSFSISKERPDKCAVIRLLLDAGVPVNETDAEGNTVLHILFAGFADRADARSAHPSQQVENWMTARTEGHILRLLLDRNADPCLRNSSGASALRVAVEQGHARAVDAIACQRRIDLVRDLPMDEILAIFNAVRHNRNFSSGRVLNHDDYFEREHDEGDFLGMDAGEPRLLNTLVDMDSTGRLSSDVPFICSRLLHGTVLSSSSELAEMLCIRGLGMGSFDGAAKLKLLRTAIKANNWDVARSLLREIPPAEVNSLDDNGQSLLSLLFATRPHRDRSSVDNATFVMELMDAGADIHQVVSPALPRGGDTTPLKRALLYGGMYPVEQMLRRQPLLGNAEAIERRYLHWTVSLQWRDDLPHLCRRVLTDDTIRILLRAGADPAQLDDKGDTPFSLVLQELASTLDCLANTYHWLKPLSRGVDINLKNKAGYSAADYLDELTKMDVDILDDILVYDWVSDGEGRKMEISWLK
ncbi:hypothetical protein NEMBOFW57_009307 [Staphylotrichum longicolle]|uniref:Ankyrin repeat protein n=1 Tax=Staphylotrichum longicolle TaxID=669026 RepID=A0AAD4ENV2_9PEZI|nr:hypothetical protein NEMBOFW57_009307 [Staphylotrichum longicolle]